MSTYFWLLALTLIGPLSRSFERKISYYKNYWALSLSTLVCGSFFLAKDSYFVALGIWGFNAEHIQGVMVFNLPVEEVLFFIVIPYSCIFIYETLRVRIKQPVFTSFSFLLYAACAMLLLGLASLGLVYTSTYSFVAAALLSTLWALRKNPRFWFYDKMVLSYFVGLIPFFLINGVLTGAFIDAPVVWYNDSENLGFRLGTIPVEDTIYFLCMQLSYVTLYELFLSRHEAHASKTTTAAAISI